MTKGYRKSRKLTKKISRKYKSRGGAAPEPPAGPPAPAQNNKNNKNENNKNKTKELEKKSAKMADEIKSLKKENQNLEITNKELRNKLISVSEDIYKLKKTLPIVSNHVNQMIKDINNYKVYKVDHASNNSKSSVEEPYLTKKITKPFKAEYTKHLNTSKSVKTNNKLKKN